MSIYEIDKHNYAAKVIGDDLLEDSVKWIGENLQVDDVFDKEKTDEYVKDNAYRFDPDELYDKDVLSEWAVDNGFRRDEG